MFLGRPAGSDVDWGLLPGDQMLVWGGHFGRGVHPVAWELPADPRAGEARRHWSDGLLAAHAAALVVIAVLLWRQRRRLARPRLAILLLFALLLGQGLVIVPEQRFMIAGQAALGSIAASALAAHGRGRTSARRYGHSRGAPPR